jgi:hypothetical protein
MKQHADDARELINCVDDVIIRYPALSWSHDQLWKMMQAYVIMYNMIIKNDRKTRAKHVGPY